MANTARFGAGCVALCVGLAGCGEGAIPEGAAGSARGALGAVVQTTDGAIQGFHDGQVLTFLGIPYAEPPLGDLRWQAPQPATPWSGVRDATAPGSPCVQGWDPSVGSEDCLVLNVFVPDGTPPDAALPTMVHLHGGGNSGGWAHERATSLVSKGVVVVTLNYRMNVFGFLAHPALTAEAGHSSNYGLLDQIAAIEWVRSNIAAFGGDPDNITLFGLSAGSFDTTALSASPLTDGLFGRAAIQGTVPWADSLTWAEFQGKRLAQGAGCTEMADPASCLRQAPVELLVGAMPGWFGDIVPVRDGYVLPDYPRVLLEEKHLDLLIGSDREEASFGIQSWVPPDFTEAEYIELMGSDWYGYGPYTEQALELYPVSDYDSPMWAVVVVETDWAYTCSTRRAALNVAANDPDVWRYLFTHAYDRDTTDGFPLGDYRTFHAIEEDYIWDGWDKTWYKPTSAERQLSDQMTGYWTNFARTGNPNGSDLADWPRYDAADERIMLLDTPPTASDAYHAPQCDLQELAHELFVFSGDDEWTPPPIDPDPPYGFEEDNCWDDACLHGCRPFPKDVVDAGSAVAPKSDFFCEPIEPSDDECSTCTRSLGLRVQRRPADAPIDAEGAIGTDLAVEYDAGGTFTEVGPDLPVEAGYCYRTAARVELSNGYAAAWTYGNFTCF